MGTFKTPQQKAAVEKMLKGKAKRKETLFDDDVANAEEEAGDYDMYDDSGKPFDFSSGRGGRGMTGAEASGRETGTKDYSRIKRVQDAAVQPLRAIRKATDYIGEKYGDLRDSTRSVLSGDPEDAEFRKGQRAVRKDTLGYKKGGKVSSASKRADGCAVRGKTRA